MRPTTSTAAWAKVALTLVLAAVLPTLPAAPAGAVTLVAGSEQGPQVRFELESAPGRPQARITTMRAGVAGSRLRVSVDRSPVAVLDRLFAADECRFEATGSVCALTLTPADPAHAALIEAFEAGLVAHVTVEDAGVMRMAEQVSLRGFTRAYRQ